MSDEVVYRLTEYDSPAEAREALEAVIEEVAQTLDGAGFTVTWETRNHSPRGRYQVVDTLSLLQGRALAMEPNSGDGRVEVFLTGQGFPLVRSRHPSGYVEWNEQARSLVISAGVEADDEGGYSTITDFFREQIGL
jgi:hypothetical protein